MVHPGEQSALIYRYEHIFRSANHNGLGEVSSLTHDTVSWSEVGGPNTQHINGSLIPKFHIPP